MLNNKVLATIALLGISATSGASYAYTPKKTGFNLGAEVSVLNKPSINEGLMEAKGFKKNKVGGNFFVGGRFDQNIGAELGYGFITRTRETGRNNVNQIVSAKHKVRNIYIDALGYAPLNRCTDLIGSLGIGRFKSKLSMPNPNAYDSSFINTANKAKLGLRLGVGLQYNICNQWSSRVMVRYQRGNKNFLRDNISVAIGASYSIT